MYVCMILICSFTMIVNCPPPPPQLGSKLCGHFLLAFACWTPGLLLLHLTFLCRHQLVSKGCHVVLYVCVVSYVLLLPIASFVHRCGRLVSGQTVLPMTALVFLLWRSVTFVGGCITIFVIWEVNGLPILYVACGPGKVPWCCLWSSCCCYCCYC